MERVMISSSRITWTDGHGPPTKSRTMVETNADCLCLSMVRIRPEKATGPLGPIASDHAPSASVSWLNTSFRDWSSWIRTFWTLLLNFAHIFVSSRWSPKDSAELEP